MNTKLRAGNCVRSAYAVLSHSKLEAFAWGISFESTLGVKFVVWRKIAVVGAPGYCSRMTYSRQQQVLKRNYYRSIFLFPLAEKKRVARTGATNVQ